MKRFLFFTMIGLACSQAQLSKDEASAFALEQFQKLGKSRELKTRELKEGFEYFEVTAAGKTMRCVGKRYGESPEGERSLFISMHGGGGGSGQGKRWSME